MRTDNIVIVGGGTAGWMTAASLCSAFPNKKITVIESADVPTVGVGESTLGQINGWMKSIGLKEEDFVRDTDASFKMSIKFTDWAGKGSGHFHYPFGVPYEKNSHFGIFDWYVRKMEDPSIPATDFAASFNPAVHLCDAGTIDTKNKMPSWNYDSDVAYHFDAAKFGIWLREKYCKPRGVNHIVGTINENVITNDAGVDYVELTTGEIIKADLYVDCTGWKSLLLGRTLNVPFNSYSEMLPNDSAWACRLPYSNKKVELEAATNCTALGHGWVWNIPLWSRTGTGYVYSSKYISDEDALEEFKQYLLNDRTVGGIPATATKETIDKLEFKKIKMRVGLHEEIFCKNVVAIGLSAGFIEPLESNGLFTVHEFLHKLIVTLHREEIGEVDRVGFNMVARDQFNAFAEFVAMHYMINTRTDTKYWKDARERAIKVEKGGNLYNIIRERHSNRFWTFGTGGIVYIAAGLGYSPVTPYDKIMSDLYVTQDPSLRLSNANYKGMDINKKLWSGIAKDCTPFYDYVKTKHEG
jgi:tryptophan halogenase